MARMIEDELRRGEPLHNAEFVIASGVKAVADEGLMRIVLFNLLCNAWKYSAKAEFPRIEFGSKMDEGQHVFIVRDNGAGFDESLAERLFKPFERLHPQSEFAGTGVGLATVRRIVNRHGGEIWATGHVDRGATFFFTLPI
jgi:signal transduction histidine kinase